MKRHAIKKPAATAAVARPEARHADQPLDLSLLHRGDEHSRRFGEKPRRLEDDFGPGRNAERLSDNIDPGQRALHRGHLERVAGHFFELWVVNRILRVDRASARTECPASRATLTVSRPIPLLAPMIRTIATASCSRSDPPG